MECRPPASADQVAQHAGVLWLHGGHQELIFGTEVVMDQGRVNTGRSGDPPNGRA